MSVFFVLHSCEEQGYCFVFNKMFCHDVDTRFGIDINDNSNVAGPS